jgi:hypothetical protein
MNFNLTLYGKNEFYPNINNKTYYVLKIDSIEKEKYMYQYFKEFMKKETIRYVGIDFEFNKVSKEKREVALMQINLEDNTNIAYIFILNPDKLLNPDHLIALITTKDIVKILHGAESLDIPYLFNQLLDNNKEWIECFCTNFYDTKFLCDYMNISMNQSKKCSIYYLLLEQKIITEKIFHDLEKIEEKTGPIYLIEFNIYKMSHEILRYSLYDVIYLPELIKKFIKMGNVYNNIIPEISCIVNKYKRNIEIEFNILAEIINSFNNFYLLGSNMRILLKEVWEMYYYTISNNILNNIKDIHYFKFFFEIMTKFFVYYHTIKHYTVYSSHNNVVQYKNNVIMIDGQNKLDIRKYHKWLKHYDNLYKIFEQFNKTL